MNVPQNVQYVHWIYRVKMEPAKQTYIDHFPGPEEPSVCVFNTEQLCKQNTINRTFISKC